MDPTAVAVDSDRANATTTVRNVLMLTRYTVWANRHLFQTLSKLPENELTWDASHYLWQYHSHANHVCDLVWQPHLEGRDYGFTTRNPETNPTFAELRRAREDIARFPHPRRAYLC